MPYAATALASKSRDRGNEERLRKDYYGDIARTGKVGEALTGRFVNDISTLDPSKGFETSTNAAFERFKRNVLGRGVRDLRGEQVGMGRLDTGFAGQDEDRLIEYGLEDLNREVASKALQAQGLDLDRVATMGSFADRYSSRAMDARGGEYQTLRQQRLADAAQRRSALGGLLQAGITAAGTVAAGPIGGAIANRFIAPQVAK
jgi:hypothetical protein